MQETWVRSLGWRVPWRRKWQPTPVFLPGKTHGQRSLVGYRSRGHKRIGYNLVTKEQQQLFALRGCPVHRRTFNDVSGFCHHVAMTPSPAPIVTTSAVSRCGHMCPGGLNPLQMKIMAVTHEAEGWACLGVVNLRGRKEVMFIERLVFVRHCAELFPL